MEVGSLLGTWAWMLPPVLLLLAALGGAWDAAHCAAEATTPYPSTFSIVAYDPANGDLGVAVQSKFLAVGSIVPWAKAGVGALATQSQANTAYGPRGLEMMAKGVAPVEVVKRITHPDPQRDVRQLGMVDARGRSGAFTGSKCLDWAGDESGPNYSIQGNILAGPEVIQGMSRAFRETKGELAERLLAALEAGQEAGGDRRGQQSAALLVVRAKGGYGGANDRYIDLRVDDHAAPISELKRLLALWRETWG